MNKKQKNLAIWGGVAAVLVMIVAFLVYYNSLPGELDSFAQCIDESGATFYGASWCPHCQSQKAMFGRSERLLPYVECSTPGTRTQNSVCNEASIQSYPTWEFADGSRQTGRLTLQELSERTGCELTITQ